MKRIYLILVAIVILAGILRFYKLDQVPPSLTWDEAAWGYNAYSLGLDGKDEFGKFLPITYLESFGDFKPPMYAYLSVIPVKVFGLNEFSTRFASAFFGTLSVLVTFFLVRRIFKKNDLAIPIAIFSALFLAISPWHINLSRAAFEANVSSFFIISGIWLFLEGIENKSKYLFFSAISFALSLYTFNTARIVSPLIVIFLGLVFWKKIGEARSSVFLAIVLGLVIVAPLIPFLLTPQAQLRFREVNIFSDIEIVKTANQEIANDQGSAYSKIIHNRRFAYGMDFAKHYLDNLNPEFLFIKGDGNPKFSVQKVGEMYLWDIPFFVMGIFLLPKLRKTYWWIIPVWLIIGIFPAATARETPHALRIETVLPTFQILTAIGFVWIWGLFKKVFPNSHLKLTGIILLILSLNVLYYLAIYYKDYSVEYSSEWQYGYKDSIAYVQKNLNHYDKVDITGNLGRPYIYYLFYTKTQPEYFRKTAKIERDVFGFVTVKSFGKYIFSDGSNYKKNTLYVRIPSEVPQEATVLKQFRVLDGTKILEAFKI